LKARAEKEVTISDLNTFFFICSDMKAKPACNRKGKYVLIYCYIKEMRLPLLAAPAMRRCHLAGHQQKAGVSPALQGKGVRGENF